MLDVSDDVRAEIGDEEANRLLAGENAPGSYDCTSCRTPGNTGQERTSTVLFVGEETAVLAFAHATCIPSQVVTVSEEQVQGAVRTITGDDGGAARTVPAPSPAPVAPAPAEGPRPAPRQAVLGVTCGQVLLGETLHAALVVEPTGPIARPGSDGPGDDFLPLLIEQGFTPVTDVAYVPGTLGGWSVLLAVGRLHAILQPPTQGSAQPTSWWQAHQPLAVTEGWRTAANKNSSVIVYGAPAGSIGQQPREDLLREALEKAARHGVLVAATMPLAGT
ncbi:hypothetical protein ACWGJ2_38925 [Streptomyces sp. NPDC054796]